MQKYLLYTLTNYRTKPYLSMLTLFLKSIKLYCTLQFDILIICDQQTHDALVQLPITHDLPNLIYHIIPSSKNLYDALLHKCDIYQYADVVKYKKVMYVDCDVIVQRDLMDVFKMKGIQKGMIYAPEEGTLKGRFWYLDAYKDSNVARLTRKGVKSFNSGTFIFIPTKGFLKHFENVKTLALNYDGKQHFYDQSFMNYYFNMKNISSTEFISDVVRIFPEKDIYYPDKYIIHFAGIGRYLEKTKLMKDYLVNLEKLRTLKNT